MTNLILPMDSCAQNMQFIQDKVSESISQEPNHLMEYLQECSSLLGTSAQTVASLQHHMNTEKLFAVEQAKREKYSGNLAKAFIEGRTAEIGALLKLSERQNAALTHRIDAIRSILSFTKEELFNANRQVA